MKNVFIIILVLSFTSCARRIDKAVSSAKYSAYEMIGMEKRDLFKREVGNVQEEQEDTSEAFKDALTQLKEIYNFDGGDLEKQYNKFNSSYKDAEEESNELKSRVAKVNKVASDLFEEWKSELNEIKDSSLRAKSSEKLSDTKARYRTLEKQLKSSEKKIDPVLARLKDQVLYLKHNLNAKAIAGLKSETGKIESDIEDLIRDVEKSSKEAEALIKTL